MKVQHGTVLKKSGSWVGRYSRWALDHSTGEKTRLQKSFTIGRVDEMTKAEARRILRERIEQELHLRSNSRMTLAGFIENRWKPLRESTWRRSTKDTNEYLLGIITERFGNESIEQADPAQPSPPACSQAFLYRQLPSIPLGKEETVFSCVQPCSGC